MPKTRDWKEIYNGDFKKHLNFVETLKPKLEPKKLQKLPAEKQDILCQRYKELFYVSLDLLKSYLIYNGIFPSDYSLVVKHSYYCEIVQNGQKWINLLFVFRKCQKEGFEKNSKLILMHFNKDYIKIFEQLDEYLKKVLLECKI